VVVPLRKEEDSDLKALLPISGLSFVMSNGYDAQYVGVIQIDDRKWKAVKHEPPGSVKYLGQRWGAWEMLSNASEMAAINPILASALRCRYQSSAASISSQARGSRR
jgi:hypothetical protein